jgi:ornithine carbamoyltransferase
VQLKALKKMQSKTLVESSTMTSLAKPQVPGQVKHYLQFSDLNRQEYDYLLKRTAWLKAKFKSYETWHPLHDRTLAMIFEKHSTRTRLSFEAGIHQLGGQAVYLNTRDTQLGRGEPVEDAAQVISRMTDIIMIRTFGQDIIDRFAANSRVPVINGLTNEFHPCQVLADIFTYVEARGPIQGKTVAWVGDANNMAYTWIQAAECLDFQFHFSAPEGYQLDTSRLTAKAAQHLTVYADPREACKGADLVSTDVWTSMGYEAENTSRMSAFKDWMVDEELMALAKPDALFMHCLPAHRGEEVTDAVLEGPRSRVWTQAENRMHAARGALRWLLEQR